MQHQSDTRFSVVELCRFDPPTDLASGDDAGVAISVFMTTAAAREDNFDQKDQMKHEKAILQPRSFIHLAPLGVPPSSRRRIVRPAPLHGCLGSWIHAKRRD